VTVQRAPERAATRNDPAMVAVTGRPGRRVLERTCFRCDGVFRVASPDRRVYCWDCRDAYGFPAPTPYDRPAVAHLDRGVRSA
jgi:hypothetical protein